MEKFALGYRLLVYRDGSGVSAMIRAIPLTEQQRQAVEAQQGGPVEVVDPATNRVYVLIAAETYARLRGVPAEGSEEGGRVTAPGREKEGAGAETAPSSAEIPAGIRRSQETFWRDLPALLRDKRHHGRWVAYHGDHQVAIGTYKDLIQACLQRGIPDDAYYLARIRRRELPPWELEEVEPLAPQHLEDYPSEP